MATNTPSGQTGGSLNQRRHDDERKRTSFKTKIKIGQREHTVHVKDISRHGAKVIMEPADDIPSIGEDVSLELPVAASDQTGVFKSEDFILQVAGTDIDKVKRRHSINLMAKPSAKLPVKMAIEKGESDLQIAKLRRQVRKQIEADRTRVDSQLKDIQACRATFAISSLGVVVAGLLTTMIITANVFSNAYSNSHSISAASARSIPWALVGIGIGACLLFVGILAGIEKVRAINQRKALLILFDQWIQNDKFSYKYPGLSTLLHLSLPQCGWLRANGFCPKLIREKNINPNDNIRRPRCWIEGENDAASWSKHQRKHLLTGPLNSFTAFTAFIYASTWVFYMILILGLASYELDLLGAKLSILSGVAFGGISVGSLWMLYLASPTLPMNRPPKIIAWVSVVALMLSSLLWIVPPHLSEIQSLGITSFRYWGLFFFAFGLGAMSSFLLHQLYYIRNGKHSLEAYFHGWRHAAHNCHVQLLDKDLVIITRKGRSITA